MEGSARPLSTATWISRPLMYCSRTVRPPRRTLSSRPRRSSSRVWAMVTPMEEPLAMGFTTAGRAVSSVRASRFSAVTVTVCQLGVRTWPATRRLVISLSMAMAELRQLEPV